LKNWQMYKWKQ